MRKNLNKPEFWAAMKNHVEEMRYEVSLLNIPCSKQFILKPTDGWAHVIRRLFQD